MFFNIKKVGLNVIICVFVFGTICTGGSVYGTVEIKNDNRERGLNLSLFGQEAHEIIDFVTFPFEKNVLSISRKSGTNVFLVLNLFDDHLISENQQDTDSEVEERKKLNQGYGFCTTNPEYRKSLIETITSLDNEFFEQNNVVGIFLKHVSYPPRQDPSHIGFPDSCYCNRCLTLFQAETGIKIPDHFKLTRDRSIWLKTSVPYEWMQWKKQQVVALVREVRELLDTKAAGLDLKLGVFLVPWKKSDFDGAVSFFLAQDPVLLEPYVDVFAPTIDDKVGGKDLDWIGDITRYFRKMTDKEIWPVIHAENYSAAEGEVVVGILSGAGADGLLVSGNNLNKAIYEKAAAVFDKNKNLIGAADVSQVQEPANPEALDFLALSGWSKGNQEQVIDSRFVLTEPDEDGIRSFGLTGGADRQARWTSAIPECVPGETYRFTAEFFRHDLSDNSAYPQVRVWGHPYLLNTLRMIGSFQKLGVDIDCLGTEEPEDNVFIFENLFVGSTFWMRNPRLIKKERNHLNLQIPPEVSFFPIGLYGVNKDNIRLVKASGVNSAVVRLERENLKACIDNDIHCTLSVPREPEQLIVELDELSSLIEKGSFSFYVNDEPGIHSFPSWQAADNQKIIKDRYPENFTTMAVVRPQVIMDYQDAADYFMMDQYPIPNMPMTWLTDSLDRAVATVGAKRLQAVIQAFGGEQYADGGWPRPPSYEEMNCLAFLAVVHGARGLYFYTYPSISSTVQSMDDFQKVVRRLNSMRSWLLQENEPARPAVTMLSENRVDPRGRAAVHCTRKTQYDTQMLICANVIKTSVEAEITVPETSRQEWQEYFGGEDYYVVDGTIRSRFKPYEVKVLFERQ